ncbi:MAG: nuclear transport factor 2 family protein [Cyanobacteria bacterium SBLK]|nr:nuclear transport factor 2 family protein [Cyanobacteria bacterium SBLK]
MPGFDATQHIITNTLVNIDGSEAEAIAYVRATHRLGDRFWIVGGYYTYQLEQQKRGWKIRSLKLTAQYEKGDRALLQQAGDRSSRLR